MKVSNVTQALSTHNNMASSMASAINSRQCLLIIIGVAIVISTLSPFYLFEKHLHSSVLLSTTSTLDSAVVSSSPPWGMPKSYHDPESVTSAIEQMKKDIAACPEFTCGGWNGRRDCTNVLQHKVEYGRLASFHPATVATWSPTTKSKDVECSRTKLGSWDFDGNDSIDFLIFHLFFYPELIKRQTFERAMFTVEFGAHNGIAASNSRFFETHLSWRALLIEPTCIDDLKRNRPNATTIHGAVCKEHRTINLPDFGSSCRGQGENIVQCYPLQQIIETNKISPVIDLVSIDTEGMEMEALQSIDFLG